MFKIRVEPREQRLQPYCGMPVCLLMKDGSCRIGHMTACRKGSVVLNGFAGPDPANIASRRTAKRKTKKQQARPSLPQSSIPPHQAVSDLALGALQIGPIHLGPLPMQAPQQTKVPLQSIDSVLIL